MERLLRSHAPKPPASLALVVCSRSSPVLPYGRSRGHDKLDVRLLASECLETLRRSKPTIETWKIEQARQARDVFVRGMDRWRWEHDSEEGDWAPRFRIRSAIEFKGDGTQKGVAASSAGARAPVIERMRRELRVRH
jgi:hypothetical protein